MVAFLSRQFNATTDLPDLSGKVFVVTGGNRGIGYSTVKHLYFHNAKVYLAARDKERALQAIDKLKKEREAFKLRKPKMDCTKGELIWLPLDLKDPRLAKKSAEELLSKESGEGGRLDVIVNNATVALVDYDISQDGVVSTMMTNHVSVFIFTLMLLPLLAKTSQAADSDVRIVTVSSHGHQMYQMKKPDIRFRNLDDFNREYKDKRMAKMNRYGLSKLANVLFSSTLQDRLAADPSNICIHPGMVDTFSDRLPLQPLSKLLFKLFVRQPDEGAYTSCFAAAAKEVRDQPEKYKGKYLGPVAKLETPGLNARNKDLGKELWETTETLLRNLGLYGDSAEI
ncbi:NAD(P)-binding protein [Mycena floridula]|nr:NAD(P)-binding protein [Mycena floridula]